MKKNTLQSFFELLQVAVGNREQLSEAPSEKRWMKLYYLSKMQSLIGIGFAGIQRLPKEQRPNIRQLAQWLKDSERIKEKNETLSQCCVKVYEKLKADGFDCCVLKGQSNLPNYPETLRDYRHAGDIDVWVTPRNSSLGYKKSMRAVIDYVLAQHRKEGAELMPEVNYHHVDWEYDGTEVEVHFRPSWLNNPIYNMRLQKWCRENGQWDVNFYRGIPIPRNDFNVIYQLIHVYRHLFSEGIGMRQILDYYMVVTQYHADAAGDTQNLTVEVINSLLHSFGLTPFEEAIMWVLQKVFNMPAEYLLCNPDERRGEFLLHEILLAGNFGKYDKRNVIKQGESYPHRFIRRQKRFLRFLTQYPGEVIWGPYFTVKQRSWRIIHGWR